MTDEPVTLSPDQRAALQIAVDVFRERAEWPSVEYVDHALDERGLASDEVLASLPADVAHYDRMSALSGSLALTVLGVSQCQGADRELDLFIRLVRLCAEKERLHKPSPVDSEPLELTSTEFVEHVGSGIDHADLVKVFDLTARDGINWGSRGPGVDEPVWTIGLNKNIRKYRGVTTLEDYIAIRYRTESETPPTAVALPPYTAIPGPVLMPSPHSGYDLDTMHPLVRDAAAALFAGGHYREGVLKATVALRDLIRTKAGLKEPDDSTLMGKALGGKYPVIVVSDLNTDTGRNVQRGVAHLAHGILARLRNPLTHEIVELDYWEAVEMLAIVSRVARDVDAGTVAESDAADAVESAGVQGGDEPSGETTEHAV